MSESFSQKNLTIDVSNVEQNRPENLSISNIEKGYVDVTGFEVLGPKFMGMTPDQWREDKRCTLAESESFDLDMDY